MTRRSLTILAAAALIGASGAALAQGGAGQFFRDEATTMKVVSKLQFNKQLLREQIDVKTNGGVVTLSGNVSTQELVALAGRLAADTGGVTKVNNLLRVGPPAHAGGPGAAPAQ